MIENWIAARMHGIEMSGIRKIFELGKSLANPVNLSIGQPHFDVPEPIRAAAKAAIDGGQNGYTVTQGIPALVERLRAYVRTTYNDPERDVVITGGTSGGLFLALMTVVNPGDEVILFDPYFVSYPHLVTLAGGTPIFIDTYPDFTIDLDKVRAALTPRTKVILFSSPANPSGAIVPPQTQRGLAELARKHGVLLLSDEIYRTFCYDAPFCGAATYGPEVLTVDGFGKTYGMTGWRLGFAHGPRRLIQEMCKLQQFTFICAPSVVQHAGLAAWDFDTAAITADYRRKRDYLTAGLRNAGYEVASGGGAFYLFPKTPWGTATEFVASAIRRQLLIIPGSVFSKRDSHFRVSYAASEETLARGIDILTSLVHADHGA